MYNPIYIKFQNTQNLNNREQIRGWLPGQHKKTIIFRILFGTFLHRDVVVAMRHNYQNSSSSMLQMNSLYVNNISINLREKDKRFHHFTFLTISNHSEFYFYYTKTSCIWRTSTFMPQFATSRFYKNQITKSM